MKLIIYVLIVLLCSILSARNPNRLEIVSIETEKRILSSPYLLPKKINIKPGDLDYQKQEDQPVAQLIEVGKHQDEIYKKGSVNKNPLVVELTYTEEVKLSASLKQIIKHKVKSIEMLIRLKKVHMMT